MSIWYRSLEPEQEPFDEGTDPERRSIVGFNVQGDKDPSSTWLQELAALLEEENLGVVNETIFLSSAVSIPGGDGPYLTIHDTGGTGRDHIHNDVAGYQRPSAKVRVHARFYLTAYDLAWKAHGTFMFRNKFVTPIVI